MSSTRQSIIDAVTARLKTITIANGYELAIGNKVYDWRVTPLNPGDLPAIEVRDGEAPIEVTNMAGGLAHRMNITVIVIASGITCAATVRKGLADIAKAMHVDRTFGGLVKTFTPLSTSIEIQQEESLLAAGQYTCNMTYYTNPGAI